MKKPEKDIDGTKLDICLQRANEKFESAYLKAADKAAHSGTASDLAEPASTISSELSDWIDSIAEESLVDWSGLDQTDNGVRSHLLKAAGNYCGMLLSAERKHQKKPDQEEIDTARDKERARFAANVGKNIEVAEKTGFFYDGPSVAHMSATIAKEVAELISDTVIGK